MRSIFQELFGSSGRGFVFPYSAGGTHATFDYKTGSYGKWSSSRNLSKTILYPLGISGITIHTTDSTAGFYIEFYQSKYDISKVNLFIKPSDSSYRLNYRLSSKSEWRPVEFNSTETQLQRIEIVLQDKFANFIEFKVNKTDSIQKEFELYGMELESNKNEGILYNSSGINGAAFTSFLRQDLNIKQLGLVAPDLVILDYGTNDLISGELDSNYFLKHITKIINQIHSVYPETCIILPSVQEFYINGKAISVTKEYSSFLRRFAKSNKVCFYDYFWISGGPKSMKKWHGSGLSKSDKTHLSVEGYKLKGQLYANAILNSFARYLQNPQSTFFIERKIQEPITKDSIVINDSIKEVKPFEDKTIKTEKKVEVLKIKPNDENKSKPTVNSTKKVVIHIVKKGETLTSIAKKYHTTIPKIKTKNKLKSDKLQIGQKLIIP
jgi:LysM repeat protein